MHIGSGVDYSHLQEVCGAMVNLVRTCMRRAAALTLPVSARARKSWSCRVDTFIDFYLYI
jgi:hypothetical protein